MTIVIAILALCTIILIHELGHFGAAKLFKMKVYQFNLGMGPILLKKKWKETQYALRMFPIGGSCMLGEDEEPGDDPREFRNKPVWQRIIVIAAGAILNLLLGLILCIIIYSIEPIPTTNISVFREAAFSNTIGTPLQVGDKVVEVNGMKIFSVDEVYYKMQNSLLKENPEGDIAVYEFVVIRDGERKVLSNVGFAPRRYNCFRMWLDEDGTRAEINSPLPESVKPLLTARGNPVYCSYRYLETFDKPLFCGEPAHNSHGNPLLKEDGKPRLCGEIEYNENGNMIYTWDFSFEPAEKNIPNILNYAVQDSIGKGRIIWLSLVDILGGTYGLNDLSGPVGIAAVVDSAAKQAVDVKEVVMMILSISAFITINLGIFNLLPVPALDGARIIFLAVEGVRRKPLNQNVEAMIHFIGFALLMLLMVFVMFNDVRKLIFGI
ncbi:MAG: site-2 protease family protein [Oscillospiraceae bacterium]|nr:site-2 protease family protein [Oscillospiraceae bacterium]